MIMPLLCYAYAKNNSNSNTVCNTDVVLPSRLRCCFIFRLVRQRQKRGKLECVALFSAADLRYLFFFCLHYFQNTKRCGISSYSAWLALRNDKSLFLQRCSACFLQKRLMFLRFTWCEDVKNYVKSDLTVQTLSDFQKCDLNRTPNCCVLVWRHHVGWRVKHDGKFNQASVWFDPI